MHVYRDGRETWPHRVADAVDVTPKPSRQGGEELVLTLDLAASPPQRLLVELDRVNAVNLGGPFGYGEV